MWLRDGNLQWKRIEPAPAMAYAMSVLTRYLSLFPWPVNCKRLSGEQPSAPLRLLHSRPLYDPELSSPLVFASVHYDPHQRLSAEHEKAMQLPICINV